MKLEEEFVHIENALKIVLESPTPDRCIPSNDAPGFWWIWNSGRGDGGTMISVTYTERQRKQSGTKIELHVRAEDIAIRHRGESINLIAEEDADTFVLGFDLGKPGTLTEVSGLVDALMTTRESAAAHLYTRSDIPLNI